MAETQKVSRSKKNFETQFFANFDHFFQLFLGNMINIFIMNVYPKF